MGDALLDSILAGDIPDDETGVDTTATAPSRALSESAAVVGGVTGAQLGGPNVPARMGLAAVGGAAGKFAGSVAEDVAGGAPFPGSTPGSMDRLADHFVDAIQSGLWQGAAEGAFPVVGQFIGPYLKRKLAEKGRNLLIPEKPSTEVTAADKLIRGAGGPGLTAGQMQAQEEKNAVSIMENVAFNAFTSRMVNQTRALNDQAVQAYGVEWLANLTKMPASDVGTLLTGIVKDHTEAFVTKPLDIVYGHLRESAPGRIVNAVPELKLLRDPKSKLGNLVSSGLQKLREHTNDPRELDALVDMLSTPAKGTESQALRNLTLEQAFRLKTELSRISGKPVGATTSLEDQSLIANAGRLASQLDKAIGKSLEHAPGLQDLYTKANKYAQTMFGVFRDDLLKGVVAELEKRPGKIADVILKPNNQDTVMAVRKAMGSKWEAEIEPVLTGTLLRDSYDHITNRFSGAQLAQIVNKDGMKETLEAAIRPGIQKDLIDFARTLELVAQKPKGSGGVFIQLASAGAVAAIAGAGYSIVTGDPTAARTAIGGETLILLAPWVMGHVVANPAWLKAMKEGLIQTSNTGKPSNLLVTTLRQAAAVKTTDMVGSLLQPEPAHADQSAPVSKRLERGTPLTPEQIVTVSKYMAAHPPEPPTPKPNVGTATKPNIIEHRQRG